MMKCKLNPDTEIVATVREGLKHNDGYCPCLVNKSEDTKCPCLKFREDKECHCGLFVCSEQ